MFPHEFRFSGSGIMCAAVMAVILLSAPTLAVRYFSRSFSGIIINAAELENLDRFESALSGMHREKALHHYALKECGYLLGMQL